MRSPTVKPHWNLWKRPLSFIWSMSCPATTFSRTFSRKGSFDIGQKLFKIDVSSDGFFQKWLNYGSFQIFRHLTIWKGTIYYGSSMTVKYISSNPADNAPSHLSISHFIFSSLVNKSLRCSNLFAQGSSSLPTQSGQSIVLQERTMDLDLEVMTLTLAASHLSVNPLNAHRKTWTKAATSWIPQALNPFCARKMCSLGHRNSENECMALKVTKNILKYSSEILKNYFISPAHKHQS